MAAAEPPSATAADHDDAVADEADPGVFSVDVVTPAGNVLRLHHVSAAETVMSLRQLIADIPQVAHYTCYDLVAEHVPPAAPSGAGRRAAASGRRAADALGREAGEAPAGVLLTDDPSRSASPQRGKAAPEPRGSRKRGAAGGASSSDDDDDDGSSDGRGGVAAGLHPCASVPGALPDRALNDFLDLAEYRDVCSGRSRLRMTMRPYDVRHVRLHLRRLRETLSHPPAPQPSVSVVSGDGAELPCVDVADYSAQPAEAAGAHGAAAAQPPAAPALPGAAPSGTGHDDATSAAELIRSVAAAQDGLRSALERLPPVPVPVPARLQSVYSPPGADAVAGPVTLLRVMQPADSGPPCVGSVSLSGWNPPPSSRAALGDLLYLDVVTLDAAASLSAALAKSLRETGADEDAALLAAAQEAEEADAGAVLHVTATASGFFVNRTARGAFDPEPLPGDAATHSSTLVGLLVRASPAFALGYASLMRRAADAAASAPSSTLAPWETLFNMSVRPPPSLRAAALGESAGGGGPSPPTFSGTFASIGEGYAFARRPWLVDPTGGRASSVRPWDGPADAAPAPGSAAGSGHRRAAGGGKGGPWWDSPSVAWVRHRHDLNRAEDELAAAFGMDERGALRDWNEEYQSCRSLPSATLQERIVRARALTKVVVDFVEAATRGALAIARGHVPPLNPTDDPSTFVYVFNSIFFSLGMDETLRRRHRRRRLRSARRRDRRTRAARRAADEAGARAAAASAEAEAEGTPETAAAAAAAKAAATAAEEAAAAAASTTGIEDALADAASMVPSNHDLHGVRALNRVDITGLHTLLTVVVDVAGRRVVAQSIIPGILQGEQASTLVYGSTDNGATVASEPAMHGLMRQACEQLGIAERIFDPAAMPGAKPAGEEPSAASAAPVEAAAASGPAPEPRPAAPAPPSPPVAASGPIGVVGVAQPWASTRRVPLCGPVECKGIVGSDGRFYVLDMVRCTPRDAGYYRERRALRDEARPEGPGAPAAAARPPWADIGDGGSDTDEDGIGACYTALLRPELLEAYQRHREEALREALTEAGDAGKDEAGTDGAARGAAETDDAVADGAAGAGSVLPVRFNVNVFTRFARATGDAFQVRRDEEQAELASAFLHRHALPLFCRDLVSGGGSAVPLDGDQLTARLHLAGINVRMLGRVANFVFDDESRRAAACPAVLELVETEMVARIARRRLNAIIRDDPRTRAAPAVATAAFLNALLGAPAPHGGAASSSASSSSFSVIPGVGERSGSLASGLDTLTQAARAVEEMGVTRDSVWSAIHEGVRQHFKCDLRLWRNGGFAEAGEAERAAEAVGAARAAAADGHATVRAALEMAAKAHADAATEAGAEDDAAGADGVGAGPSGTVAAEAAEVLASARAEAEARDRRVSLLEAAVAAPHRRVARCHRVPLLRRLCQKAGIQVVSREYMLGGSSSAVAVASAAAGHAGDRSAASGGASSSSASSSGASGKGKGGGKRSSGKGGRSRGGGGGGGTARAAPVAEGWAWYGGAVSRGVAETPFRVSDVAGLVPVVKHCLPTSLLRDATVLHEEGQALLGEGRLQEAYQCVQEALLLLYQVCGAAHAETASCCSTLAVVLWHAGDKLGAVAQQQRATVLMELLCGLDHHEAALAHSNLAYFLGGCNETQAAAVHMRRSLFLMDMLGGPSGGETVATWLKLGMVYQDGQHAVMAVACFREALRRCGHDASQAAACLHALAVAHSVGGGFQEAAAHEQRAADLLAPVLGKTHPRVLEAVRWTKQFARKAQTLSSALLSSVGHAEDADAAAPGPAAADRPADPAPAPKSGTKPKRRRAKKGSRG